MSTLRKPTPRRAAALAQLRLLYKEKYPAGLITVVLLSVFFLRTSTPAAYYDQPPWQLQPLLPNALIILIFVGLIGAAFTWINEPPSRRGYHRSLPVPHRQHDSLRLLAGITWLVVTLLVFCVAGALSEDRVLREQWLMRAPTVWFGFFAVPLLAYLLCSIFAVASDRMVVWLASLAVVALVMDSSLAEKYLPEARDAARAILWDTHAPYSLAHALTGAARSAPWTGTSDTDRVFSATVDNYIKAHPEYAPPMQTRAARARSIEETRRYFELQGLDELPPSSVPWLKALGVWWLIAIGGLVLAVNRKPAG